MKKYLKQFSNNFIRYRFLSYPLLIGVTHIIIVLLSRNGYIEIPKEELTRFIQYSRYIGVTSLLIGITLLPTKKIYIIEPTNVEIEVKRLKKLKK